MYIYSQDRRYIEKLYELSVYDSQEGGSILVNGMIRATYSTSEKCMAVMNDVAMAMRLGKNIYKLPK